MVAYCPVTKCQHSLFPLTLKNCKEYLNHSNNVYSFEPLLFLYGENILNIFSIYRNRERKKMACTLNLGMQFRCLMPPFRVQSFAQLTIYPFWGQGRPLKYEYACVQLSYRLCGKRDGAKGKRSHTPVLLGLYGGGELIWGCIDNTGFKETRFLQIYTEWELFSCKCRGIVFLLHVPDICIDFCHNNSRLDFILLCHLWTFQVKRLEGKNDCISWQIWRELLVLAFTRPMPSCYRHLKSISRWNIPLPLCL